MDFDAWYPGFDRFAELLRHKNSLDCSRAIARLNAERPEHMDPRRKAVDTRRHRSVYLRGDFRAAKEGIDPWPGRKRMKL